MVRNGIFEHQASKSLTRNMWRPSAQQNWGVETAAPPSSPPLEGV